MFVLTWLTGLLRTRTLRLAGTVIGVTMTVALLGSLGAFFAASKAQMTRQAAAGIVVDWQVQVAPGADVGSVGRVIASAPGVLRSLPVSYASATGLSATAGGTTQTTGAGEVLGLPAGYSAAFPGEIRYLTGARTGVLLAQQTAANLHASPGTTIVIGRPGLPPVHVVVRGIVDLPAADSMFQAVGSPPGSSLQAPPDNVVLLPQALWQQSFGLLGAKPLAAVHSQYHVKLSSALAPDPATAYADVTGRAKNLEVKLAGAGLVGNNLAAQLDAARKDALYAQLLFLFLGIPGAVLAAALTAMIAASGGERRRREQALLRIRGATPRQIVRLAAAEALLVGILGAGLGLLGAALAGRLAFGVTRFGATTGQAIVWGLLAGLTGVVLAVVTELVPAARDARKISVRQAREVVGRGRSPLWARLYVDLWLLAAAGVVFWRSAQSGYQVVLAPEGVATISVSYSTFLAPLLLWIGAALLSWRLAHAALDRGREVLAKAFTPLAGGLAGVVTASMSRQRRLLSRGLLIMALTASFAVSTAIFNQTYAAQSRVDAQLTNGSDVTAATTAESGLPPRIFPAVKSIPGVQAVQPMMHRFAYVGNDLQDMFGINPRTIQSATAVSDAFFQGGNARSVLAALAARPDAVLVSDETVRDYQLAPGGLIRLRLQFAGDHAYHVVPFHYVGIVREFPTAPRDSFFVTNAAYIARMTGSPAYQVMLTKVSGSPPAIAAQVRHLLGPASGAVVQDIHSQLKITLSGLTTIDLSGLTRLELTFAFILAVAASSLILLLGLIERRRMFAITSALGAKTRQLGSFVWAEALFVTVGGVVLGIASGWGLSYVIVKILTGVFDPPPPHLFIPWVYLASLAAVTAGAIVWAGVGAVRSARKPAMDIIRDL
ncbi:MAG TPA: ABC transporter permease [Streptosporangiaceae bacterium]|nr:ABC transporter permease [Streptosporangiaceae bacterium]